jgi:[protein-PII] uridylyltransferase
MATLSALQAKIAENARQRLVLPPLSRPSDELPRYRHYMKGESLRLRMHQRAGAGGLEVCRARSWVVDLLLRQLWDAALHLYPPVPGGPRLALVAFGGYGRAELCPMSDVDLMFLHDGTALEGGKAGQQLAEWVNVVLYPLWDLGFKVGHASLTVEDAIEIANRDMLSKTSYLDARLVAGDEKLFRQFEAAYVAECVKGHAEEYIQQRLEDQRVRRLKHGNSPALQEPNIKNGVGGLRDFHNLLWMAYFRKGTRTLKDLQDKEFIGPSERRQLESAYDFLLRARNELHHVAGRPLDVLAANVKPAVASGLGYDERSPRARVERFMRDYYTHARNIYLITRTLEQRLALVPAKGSGRRIARPRGPVFDGFRIVGDQLWPTSRSVLREDPRRCLRAFLHCQQRGLSLHPDLAQIMRQQVELLDRRFLADRHNHVVFLEILNHRGNVAPHVRAMHEVGFLGKFIPEFGRLTNLVQHEFYHQYAVDEHTLTCVEKLDAVWSATTHPQSQYTPLLRSLERPFVLYLALLLHDAGKALDGARHEIIGGRLAESVSRRLKLDAPAADTIRKTIELHLLMVQVSQRRDLDDPAVIADFARDVGSAENLAILTLHTFADSSGTSDTLWTGFKDALLWTLHHRAMAVLKGEPEFAEARRAALDKLRDDVRAALPRTFAPDEIEAHFGGLPPRYFHIHPVRGIARDLTMAHQFMHLQLTEDERSLEPVVAWVDDPDRGYAAVHVCTWDRAGLFSKVAGSLTAAGLNIFGAQVFTRADGIVLDTFYVAETRGGALPGPEPRQRFERILVQVLTGKADLVRLVAQAPRAATSHRMEDDRIPPRVRVSNAVAEQATVVDLEADDRPGLLHRVSHALYELGLSILFARIVTEKGVALDTFYVTDVHGSKVMEPGRLAVIEASLRGILEA